MTERSCAGCGAALKEGDLFCPNCGAPAGAPSFACPQCGSRGESGAFCGRCGAYLGPKKEKKDRKKAKKAALRVLAAALALALLAGVFSYAAAGSFRKMGDWFLAVRYLAKGNLYSACGELEQIDTPVAEAVLRAARRSAYRKGVKAYRAGEYGEASQLLSVCGDVEDSGRYRLLASSHVSGNYYNDDACARMVEEICGMWDFEDAPDGLVFNQWIARTWLAGRWETEDGKYYFELNGERLRYNLPHDASGNAFRISGGYLYQYFKGSEETEDDRVFRFYPMNADAVSVYCISNGKYYNLYRNVTE